MFELEFLADLASITALFISIYLIIALKQIRKHFLFKARFPELKNSLEKMASQLSELLNEYQNSVKDIKHLFLAGIDR